MRREGGNERLCASTACGCLESSKRWHSKEISSEVSIAILHCWERTKPVTLYLHLLSCGAREKRKLTESELCACSRVYERTASSTRGSGIRRQNGGERIEYHIQKQSRNSMQAPIVAERKCSPSPPWVGHTITQSVVKVLGT